MHYENVELCAKVIWNKQIKLNLDIKQDIRQGKDQYEVEDEEGRVLGI